MAKKIFVAEMTLWIKHLSGLLHRGNAWRLAPLLWGMLFARGRRTVASWLRVAELGDDYQGYYYFLGSLGRNVKSVAGALLRLAVSVICPGERLLFAIDDTPTKRYGKHVEGAGIHHNPTPGPAEQKFLYGHVWVTLSWVVRHAAGARSACRSWRSCMCGAPTLRSIAPWYKVKFQTKLEQAAALVEWAACYVNLLGKKLWIVVDGAYVKKPFLKRAKKAGVTVVGRLAQGRGVVERAGAGAAGATQAWRAAQVRQGPDQPGQASRASSGLDARNLQAVRCREACLLQDVPGDVQAGGRFDPRRAGARTDGSWRAYCCTEANATRGGDSGSGGGSLGDRTELSRPQGSAWHRPTATAELLGQHRRVPSDAVAAHADRSVGLAQAEGGVGGPQRQSVGRCDRVVLRMRIVATPCAANVWKRNFSAKPTRIA